MDRAYFLFLINNKKKSSWTAEKKLKKQNLYADRMGG